MAGRKSHKPVTSQESLFVPLFELEIAPTTCPGSVDLSMRSLHLVNSLNLRDEALELKRFVSRGLARQRYGKAGADNITRTYTQKYADAELEFNRAYGLDTVLELSDPAEHASLREEAQRAYKMFYSGYGSEETRPSPERKRNKRLPKVREELGAVGSKYAENARIQPQNDFQVTLKRTEHELAKASRNRAS